ncbi:right-handed parallel beta-helix repeat-containing protein [Paenisporosarcina quisquiliarum]|uniref:Right-handed parallel beta-helix repeat-containing protein n=1 Tax=Paenisporosarcina quisquiliarum TaxID=365346 RepID=A0A9X3LHY5_9BACL|nr:NosD domain-containing protein [Paenisporosarcina quisquiliarum]MCZ8538343.1 right-handed parallel beta-helix repeat-containing protein [Paenisporosarcina quisquiliarum]
MKYLIKIFVLLSLGLFGLLLPNESSAMPSLQQQIDDADPGSTIVIDPGVYYENLTITKPLTIIGKGLVELHSPTSEAVISVTETANVQLQQLVLKGTPSSDKSTGIAVKNSKDITLQNMELHQLHESLVFFRVEDSVIQDVTITGPKGHFSRKSNGITLTDTVGIKVQQVHIENVLDGLYIDGDRNSVVSKTDISQSRYGIHLMYSKGTTIHQNHLHNNVTGIMHMMTSNSKLNKNVIENHNAYNGFGMVLFDGQSIQVKGNQIRSNQSGLSFQQIHSSTVKSNVVGSNQKALQFQLYGADNQFVDNEIFGNIVSATSDNQGAALSGNYWDDYSGMDFDSDGYGDTPYQSSDSYAKLMVRQNEFQAFFEAPAVATLNQIEKQLALNTKQSVFDDMPKMHRERLAQTTHIQWGMLLIGIISLVGGIGAWRKLVK